MAAISTIMTKTSQGRRTWVAALTILLLVWMVWFLNVPSMVKDSRAIAGVTKAIIHEEHPLLDTPPTSAVAYSASNFPTPTPSHPPPPLPKHNSTADRPLILYAFFDTPGARLNLEFFIRHALHDAADFLFVLNGETDAANLLPKRDNIRFVKRANDCYDLGAFAEILTANDTYKAYNRYILMNASIRGPFFPYWSNQCWSDVYLDKLNEKTKLVGMTMNCEAPVPHIQSMFWALNRAGLETLLYPSEELLEKFKASLPPYDPNQPVPEMWSPGINSCPHEYWKAVAVEVYSTALVKAAGYEVDAMMSAYRGFGDALARGEEVDLGGGPVQMGTMRTGAGYESICKESLDPLLEKQYWGTTIHPFDTVFAKTNRGSNMGTIERLTQWTAGRQYSSYDVCR
ncbi:hypothetical protein BDZ45DRAFT_747595 [Acephala macrosclerotiorum]|nr:hypothetical protein BDZ45DRAFT_747595 [Acephala macrosclerotiorum]